MSVDLLFGLVALVVIVIVFSTRGRREKTTTASREHVLQALSPVVAGSLSKGEVTGTYQGHPVEASLRTSGRVDVTGSSHSSTSNIEVLLFSVHGVSGTSPWGFFTSVSFPGTLEHRWRSAITFAGVLGKWLSHLSTVPIDPTIDDRLREGGMLQALERLVPRGVKAPYVLVAFVPDGAPAIARTLQRMEAIGGAVAERARREAAGQSRLGGHLRIEVERASDHDPSPERFRELLDAAMMVAELNASLNR